MQLLHTLPAEHSGGGESGGGGDGGGGSGGGSVGGEPPIRTRATPSGSEYSVAPECMTNTYPEGVDARDTEPHKAPWSMQAF